MIFITLGSQKFQFNRLLIEIDDLIKNGEIIEEVFAQIGYSDYKPKNFKFKNFLNRDEFLENIEKSNIVITHGGTGAIVGAIKKKKKVIAVPRLAKFGEHVDDHQTEIVSQFKELNLIETAFNKDELIYAINTIENTEFKSYVSNTNSIIDSIIEFIETE